MSDATDTRPAGEGSAVRRRPGPEKPAANKPGAEAGAEKRPAAPAPGAAPRRGAAAAGAAPGTAPGKPGNGKPAAANGTAAKAAPAGGPVLAGAKAAPAATAPVPPIQELEAGSYRNVFIMAGAVFTSLIVHLGVIIMLGLIFVVAAVVADPPQFEAITEREQEVITQIVDNSTVPSTNMSAPSQSVAAVQAGHTSAISSPVATPTLDTEVAAESEISVAVGPLALVEGVPAATMSMELPEGTPGDPQSVVDSVDEAMDRITQEILGMMAKNKVLVVWLFDESESMKDDQQEIKGKIERVYQELGLLGKTKGDVLMTGVASYGKDLHIHSQQPTGDPETVRKYIDAVPVDESGEEQMCFAVGKTINYFSKFARGRQMAVILVTDESGDSATNYQLLEPTIAEAKKARSRIYVLGREAVFGYPYAYMRWQDPKTQINYWLRIDRGPETAFVEQLQTDGFWRRFDAHASGFGPYEQSRMARETGGIFFMLPSPETNLVRRDDRKYALARLRPYMPNLEDRDSYAKDRDRSEMRKTLWKVINDLNPWQNDVINMREHFSMDDAEFRQQALKEMEDARKYVIYLDAAEKALEKLAEQRRKETYPRWQANYDLIYAQVLAYKVRIYQYGAYLQWWLDNPDKRPKKSIKPPNPRTTLTRWDIRTRKEVIPTPNFPKEELDKYIAKSSELFKKVIADHAGTPWESRAKYELSRGFGVHLVQEWDDPRRGRNVNLPKF